MAILIFFFTLPIYAMKIVALSPNLTVIAHQIILNANYKTKRSEPKIVGTIRYQGEPKYFSDFQNIGTSSAINIQKIILLNPDVILAWGGASNIYQLAQLQDLGYRVVTLHASNLYDISRVVKQVGLAIKLPKSADNIAKKYLSDLDNLIKSNKSFDKVKVFIQLSSMPLYTVGNQGVISDVIDICGGKNIFDDLNREVARVNFLEVIKRQPDMIFIMKSNLELVRTTPVLVSIWRKWPFMSAVKGRNIYWINANLLSQNTPQIILGIKNVCKFISRFKRIRNN
jgi:iron complex transport system substrate-binding protein